MGVNVMGFAEDFGQGNPSLHKNSLVSLSLLDLRTFSKKIKEGLSFSFIQKLMVEMIH